MTPTADALFAEHHRAVMAYCLLATKGDRASALDLVQDVFGRVFEHLPTLKEPQRAKGWLFTIAANVVRNRGEQESRRRHLLEGFALELGDPRDGDESPSERERRVARVREVVAAIEDPVVRELASAHYVDGENTRDIAARLGMPHGTVTVKLMRFRERLKRDFAHAIAEGDWP